ncbi:MAG TPA: dipeptide/oligopeptide/nickel ABC transporter ATP-binding protein [Bryobacteraceae bacterium]|nr:dipeptide/oligopeptide/nickel ABC transporter ATP-binding protein [Bryobacteraceae bacterium]
MTSRDSASPILRVRGLTKTYRRRKWIGSAGDEVRALRGVDLDLCAGKTIAIVGASGGGKSTLARCVAGLEPATSGEIFFRDQKLGKPGDARHHIQMIFQDSGASLNPRFSVAQALLEPLAIRQERNLNTSERLRQVGLPETLASQGTSQLSGGQKARLALARALAALGESGAAVLILDESLASLDLSVQAQMINLLVDLQEKRGLAYLLIAHDLRLAAHLADEIAVLFEGQIVERGAPHRLFAAPAHPHTAYLLKTLAAPDGSSRA